jgi:hypothetical protein
MDTALITGASARHQEQIDLNAAGLTAMLA